MINKYRKKPVVIEAVQLKAKERARLGIVVGLFDDHPQWLLDAITDHTIERDYDAERESDYTFLKIKKIEGVMTVSPGDYIIQGVKGELYPCKPDIFELTYEKVKND